MSNILTLLIALLTALICWQNIFSNNVVLFKARLKLYNQFSIIYHRFLNFVERFNQLSVDQLVESVQKGSLEMVVQDKKILLINEFAKLEAMISEMLLMDFNPKIISHLDDIKDHSTIICDYLVGGRENVPKPSKEQFDAAFDHLKANIIRKSALDQLFKKDLTLRNFKYYRRHFCSYLCS